MKRLSTSILLSLFLWLPLLASPYLGLSQQQTLGTPELQQRAFQLALKKLAAADSVSDTLFHAFKLALAHAALDSPATAVPLLRTVCSGSPQLAPIAWEQIGDIEWRHSRDTSALSAYRAALALDIPQRYQLRLNDKISAILLSSPGLGATLSWLPPAFYQRHSKKQPKATPLLDSLVQTANWPAVDSVATLYLMAQGAQEPCDVLAPLWSGTIADSFFTTQELFRISLKARNCKQFAPSSDWLHKALARADFDSTIEAQEYLLHRGMLNYDLGNWNQCIQWLSRYEKQFGPTPAVVLTTARAWRKMGKEEEAATCYDRHVLLYPENPMSSSILWLRAWDLEDKHLPQAVQHYRTIYTTYPAFSRAEESRFRCGLSLYKHGEYPQALEEWNLLLKLAPGSSVAPATRYWQAKAFYALAQFDTASAQFQRLLAANPVDYYAYRSREMLALMSDTLPLPRLSPCKGLEQAELWLDSLTNRTDREFDKPDSARFTLGVQLALCGLVEQAEFYLEPLEQRYPANLRLQFELSQLYRNSGAPTLSYRVAQKFTWRIPEQHRATIPQAVYELMYPRSFDSLIVSNAQKNRLEPWLLSAIIRQESIFNPRIVSPAGAIGLMQIMPATGQTLATTLKEPFTPDSLYNPVNNVRWGATYVRELLDQFEGNIVLALASYNGGPHNAIKWYAINRDDEFDLFVEDLAFSETRGYVKKVLANYWTYGQLQRTAW